MCGTKVPGTIRALAAGIVSLMALLTLACALGYLDYWIGRVFG